MGDDPGQSVILEENIDENYEPTHDGRSSTAIQAFVSYSYTMFLKNRV